MEIAVYLSFHEGGGKSFMVHTVLIFLAQYTHTMTRNNKNSMNSLNYILYTNGIVSTEIVVLIAYHP